MTISKEKQQILDMSDEEVRQLLRLAGKLEKTGPSARGENRCGAALEAALRDVVGLEEPKRTLLRIIAFHRLQQEAAARGRALQNLRCHMCFVGNPGTAKTTFARACGKAFRMEGLLSKGSFTEVGRAELVAPYEGQTAQRVKDAVKKAAGGVLFIDEAYALVENQEGAFGDEAIAALVQELENTPDLVVIFAGYPDKMEAFLNRNPGLKSRIPFTVHFPDYTSDELVRIAGTIAAKGGFRLDGEAELVIRGLVEQERRSESFGNARFVRNLVEAAELNRASALAWRTDLSSLPDAELFVLRAADFEKPRRVRDCLPAHHAIGF